MSTESPYKEVGLDAGRMNRQPDRRKEQPKSLFGSIRSAKFGHKFNVPVYSRTETQDVATCRFCGKMREDVVDKKCRGKRSR